MAPATKMPCKNNSKYMYTGKEMSPLGLGFAAEGEAPGTQMVGRDNKHWIVGVKNNEKIWLRAPEKIILQKEDPVLDSDGEEIQKEVVEEKAEPKKKGRKPKVVEEVEEVVEEKAEPKKKGRKPKVVEEEEEKAEPKKKGRKPKVDATRTKVAESETEGETKKAVRKAPKDKANTYDEGYEMEGEDGEMYTVKCDKNGTKRWYKTAGKKTVAKKTTENNEETEEKPKRKYVRKAKAVDDTIEEPVKEKKKRGPSGYNLWFSATLIRLRKEEPGLDTTDYMTKAHEIWGKMTKDEQKEASLKAKGEVAA